jgi:hypothetical protein
LQESVEDFFQSSKLRLAQKRRKAAWNDDYRAKVVFG